MLKVDASEFLHAVGSCTRVALLVQTNENPIVVNITDKLEDDTVVAAKHHLNRILEHAVALGAKATAQATRRAIENVDHFTGKQLGDANSDIESRLKDELSGVQFIYLDPNATMHFEPSEPLFGIDVDRRFPGAAFEIDECGKCYALKRYTAAVFHLMRCLETAIRALSRFLNIEDPTRDADRNWGKMLRGIKSEIEQRNSGSKRWKRKTDRAFVEDIYASLDAVRNVWRNATMHVEKTYTQEEAAHIMMNVRVLMRKLAAEIDGDGKLVT